MSDPINDGGPAFPMSGDPDCAFDHGMSLRDWFAGQAPQPGVAEICNLLGLKVQDHAPVIDRVVPPEERLPWFRELWQAMTLDKQMEVSAICRYRFADAMLAAREARP